MRKTLRGAALLGALCLACGITPALANEAGSALKADDLRAEPFADAKAVGKVAKGDALTIVTRQGGWYQVKAGATTGWVRMLSVRRGEGGKASATDEIAGAAGAATGRSKGQVVSTTGVRGLSEADLKQAKFNEAEIAKAERHRASADDAKGFAGQAGLQPRQMAFLGEGKTGEKK